MSREGDFSLGWIILVSGLVYLCEMDNFKKISLLFCAWKPSLKEKLAKCPTLLHDLEKFPLLAQGGCSRPSVGFSTSRFGWKNENPCSENFSGVLGQKLPLRGCEESQGFPELKHSKYKNGFFSMSSLDLKLSRTIFGFPIERVETKIFEFEDFGLEVERSQSVDPKISKWVFSDLFLLPHRTHSNWRNWIWMRITHFMNFRRSTNCQLKGRWKVARR